MRGIAIASALAIAACANNVPQDRSTGPDGKQKGAKPITLVEGEALVKGVVTYPGGDRVDWKVLELPDGKKGRLDLSMKWATPRPGLQLGFDVFDQWGGTVANAKGSKGRVREASVTEAKGKYFVRVYAKGRGDAGSYKLAVAFKETSGASVPDPLKMDIPQPPRLPSIPGLPCETFDARDPECKSVCPLPNSPAPPNWKPCIDAGLQQPPVGPTPPPPPPPLPPPAKPIAARVISVNVQGDNIIVTIPAGSEQGVDKTWTGQVMRGDTKQPLVGARVEIIRVDKQRTVARVVGVTVDIITSNPNVVIQP
jgi:hypothetical protein